jgi:hypothetical protein
MKRRPLYKSHPQPRSAAMQLIRKYGHDRAARYARDRESNWGPQCEWWNRVVEAMPQAALDLANAKRAA